MNWNQLTTEDQLEAVLEESKNTPVLIFKHSTRCSISSMVKSRLERFWKFDNELKPYYLDLIQFRNVSNLIAQKLNVEHQSPQAIVLKDRYVFYYASHMSISLDKAVDLMKN